MTNKFKLGDVVQVAVLSHQDNETNLKIGDIGIITYVNMLVSLYDVKYFRIIHNSSKAIFKDNYTWCMYEHQLKRADIGNASEKALEIFSI